MTNKEKVNSMLKFFHGSRTLEDLLLEMAEWKDKQIYLLIDAIDHAYLQTDGTYGELSYEVSDQVKYLKKQLKGENV